MIRRGALVLALLGLALAGCTTSDGGADATNSAGTTATSTGTESSADTDAETTTEGTDTAATAGVTSITFPSGERTLAGDLRLPEAPATHPGVVLVHGSGPQSRDHEVMGQLGMNFGFAVPVFRQLAEQLREAGFAVLTYDKRSCGPFNDCADNDYPQPPDDLTIDAFVADAAAALTALAAREEVAADQVAVAGLSQGATFVPLLLADGSDLEAPTAAAGVMLAPPHDPIDEVVAAQAVLLRDLLTDLGASEQQIEQSIGSIAELADEVADVGDGSVAGPPIGGASRAFWASWIELGERAPQLAAALEEPLLVLGGTLDYNVPPAQIEAWRTTLADSAGARVISLDCVTHALTCVTESDPAAMAREDFGQEVADDVVDTVVEFLDANLAGTGS